MTTKDKGITLPASYPYTDISTAAGFKVTDTPNDYTSKSAWIYGPAASVPVNPAPLTLTTPRSFAVISQNANPAFAAKGGDVFIQPGVGSGGNPSGNLVVLDTAGFGGAWSSSHLVLGGYHLWIDSNNRLRIKTSVPGGSNEGNPVGWDLLGQGVYDPPNLADGTGVTTSIGVAGAVLGDMSVASFTLDLQGILMTSYVSGANVVSVRFQNETGGAIDLASGTISARVVKL